MTWLNRPSATGNKLRTGYGSQMRSTAAHRDRRVSDDCVRCRMVCGHSIQVCRKTMLSKSFLGMRTVIMSGRMQAAFCHTVDRLTRSSEEHRPILVVPSGNKHRFSRSNMYVCSNQPANSRLLFLAALRSTTFRKTLSTERVDTQSTPDGVLPIVPSTGIRESLSTFNTRDTEL